MSILEGKRALVAGGTAGIGLAVAQAYAQEGADVTIGGRRPEGEAIAIEAGCRYVQLDIADEESVKAAVALTAPLDILVINAGVSQPPTPLAATSSKVASHVVATNLMGPFYLLKHAAEHLNDGASIIITSSISAVMGTSFEGIYGATKAGASSLARSAAIDLGPRGIRANAVQPGPTWTDMNPMPERLLEIAAPAGRKGRVEDLIGLYVFLASDASSYLTGQQISVDGGITAGQSQALLGAAIEKALSGDEVVA